LNEIGYLEGRSITIEYRYADNRMDQPRPLAADLIARKVAVIAAVGGNNTGLVAKTLTSMIPIVFSILSRQGSSRASAGRKRM
jgi:putative ABC transport system substrate-binding protein